MFIHAMQRQRHNIATMSLTAAVALKPFPAVFLVLLLEQRRFKHALGVVLVSVALNALGVPVPVWQFIVGSGVPGLNNYTPFMSSETTACILGIVCGLRESRTVYVFQTCQADLDRRALTQLADSTFGSRLALSGVLSVYIVSRKMVFWKKVTLLVCAMNLLPYVSGDYKTVDLFVALFLVHQHGAQGKGPISFSVCFLGSC